MINAAVFPEPVTAFPTISFPRRATGIVAAWIGVGIVKPKEVTALSRGRDKFMLRKDECCSDGAMSDAKYAVFLSFSACVSSASESSEESSEGSPSSSSDCPSSSSSSSPSEAKGSVLPSPSFPLRPPNSLTSSSPATEAASEF
jgi:hypothetical protein